MGRLRDSRHLGAFDGDVARRDGDVGIIRCAAAARADERAVHAAGSLRARNDRGRRNVDDGIAHEDFARNADVPRADDGAPESRAGIHGGCRIGVLHAGIDQKRYVLDRDRTRIGVSCAADGCPCSEYGRRAVRADMGGLDRQNIIVRTGFAGDGERRPSGNRDHRIAAGGRGRGVLDAVCRSSHLEIDNRPSLDRNARRVGLFEVDGVEHDGSLEVRRHRYDRIGCGRRSLERNRAIVSRCRASDDDVGSVDRDRAVGSKRRKVDFRSGQELDSLVFGLAVDIKHFCGNRAILERGIPDIRRCILFCCAFSRSGILSAFGTPYPICISVGESIG